MTPKAPTYIESDTVALPDAWLERGDHRIPLKLRVDPSEVGALDGDPLGGANAEHAREIAARLDAVRQTVDAVDATVGQLDRPLETFAAADSPVARSVASLPQPARLAAALPALPILASLPQPIARLSAAAVGKAKSRQARALRDAPDPNDPTLKELHARASRDAPDLAHALRDAPGPNDLPSIKELDARALPADSTATAQAARPFNLES
ncbi:MAG TPA: hypothetical protein VKA12_04935 [Roseiarcus sp.]|nr:hypothetical protein [Roseiarcus sp.]